MELSQTERDLVRFFDLSLDLFCIRSLDGSFVRVNTNFLRVLGYTSDELLARPFLEFVHPEDRRGTQAEMAKLAQGLPVVMFRNRYRDAQGAYHWLEWMSTPIPEENTVFAVARDVSQQVRIEQELIAREQRERAILENTSAVIYVKGPDGRYQYVNQQFADRFGLERTAVIGKSDHDLFPRKMADEFRKNDRRVMESREVISIQESAPHADGERTYISVKFPLLNSGGSVEAVAGISTDITDQIRAREMDGELQFAQVFQQKLYPATNLVVPGVEVAGAAVPAATVSGDYFDYFLRDDGRVVIAVGDVAGHGFGAAMEMVEVRTVLRLLLRGAGTLQNAMEELNRWLCTDLENCNFVTLLLAEIDTRRRELHYIGAGHDAFLWKSQGEPRNLPSTGLALGIEPSACFAASPPVRLAEGDLLTFFTDGLTDATNASGERFGARRLRETLGGHRHEPPQALLESLFAAVRRFTNGQPIPDDMTAVFAKVMETSDAEKRSG
ncbi:MAG: SpoIIE family protein phosphatase [Planctomycetes bacterium]|nr:SpoIIE family protein phosphatase [Planctomycetota bacterium]